jgi:hypothetical protein
MNGQPKKIFIGCDPGQSGGFVVLSENGIVLEVFKTPENISDYGLVLGKYSDIEKYKVILVKEKVHSQPRHGGKANFTFGYTVGVLESSLVHNKIPFFDITPQTWMKLYMMKKEKEEPQTKWKNRLKAKAQSMFPHEKVSLWNSDAFLIAEYARQVYK